MAYMEKDFQTDFNKWSKAIYRQTAAFELKISKTDSISFNRLEDHQQESLFHAKHNHLIYKIPDDSIGYKPFDCFMLSEVPAFVVVMFNASRKSPFYLIDIDVWINEDKTSKRRSLTVERAQEIGHAFQLGVSSPLPHTLRT